MMGWGGATLPDAAPRANTLEETKLRCQVARIGVGGPVLVRPLAHALGYGPVQVGQQRHREFGVFG